MGDLLYKNWILAAMIMGGFTGGAISSFFRSSGHLAAANSVLLGISLIIFAGMLVLAYKKDPRNFRNFTVGLIIAWIFTSLCSAGLTWVLY